jgi:hypothetical protein
METLVNSKLSQGVYEVNFNGKNLSSGTYFYRLNSGNNTLTKTMALIK